DFGPADSRGPLDRGAEEGFAFAKPQAAGVEAVVVEDVEEVEICGELFGAARDLRGAGHVKTLLKRAEAGEPVVAEADDLAVENRRGADLFRQRRNDLGKLKILLLVVAADECHVPPLV